MINYSNLSIKLLMYERVIFYFTNISIDISTQ